MMNLEKVSYKGMADCLSLSNDEVELIITTGLGPRVLFYGYVGGQNFFRVFEDQVTNVKPGEWQSYGGHRLWHAPEVFPRTYYPDNDVVEYDWDGKTLTLTCVPEVANDVVKTIEITLDESGTGVSLNHTIKNTGPWSVELSAWCLSVMAPGGRAVIPQEE